MNRRDREEIVTFVVNMMRTSGPNARDDRDVVVRKFVDACNTPGSGACICQWPPEKARVHCEQTYQAFEVYGGALILEHRCDKHGERAQPKLWGRNKTLELHVTPKQWLALGVEYDEPEHSSPQENTPEEDPDGYRTGDISPQVPLTLALRYSLYERGYAAVERETIVNVAAALDHIVKGCRKYPDEMSLEALANDIAKQASGLRDELGDNPLREGE